MQNRSWLMAAAFLLAAPFICRAQDAASSAAFEFGSGNRRNRRQCDAHRNADQRDRQFRDSDHGQRDRARSKAHVAGRSSDCARPEHCPKRRPGRQDVRVHARQQFEPHQGVDRWNRRNDPSQDGVFDFGQVLTSDIAQVEVLRGPQSSLYGSDAIGGVVNIVTKTGEGPPQFTGRLEGGSFETFNQSASVSGSVSRFRYSFNVAHVLADDTPVTPLDLLPPGRKRINDSYENITVSTKLGADLTDIFSIDFAGRYTDSTLFFTGEDFSFFPSVPAAAQSEQNARQLFMRGDARLALFGGAFKNRFGVGYTNYHTTIQAPDTGFGVPPENINHGDRLKFDWQGDVELGKGHVLILGVEDQTDRLIDSPISAENGNTAGFTELQSEVIENLFVAGSGRYDDNERFGGKATWRIAPAYLIPKSGTKFKASYGTGFKAPSLTQLFVSFPAFNFFANPNLEPEESEGFDLGFEQALAGERVRFGATYFHNDITNLIAANATFTSLENLARPRRKASRPLCPWR